MQSINFFHALMRNLLCIFYLGLIDKGVYEIWKFGLTPLINSNNDIIIS